MSSTTAIVTFANPVLTEVHDELKKFVKYAGVDAQLSQTELAENALEHFEKFAPTNAARWARTYLAGAEFHSGDTAVQLRRVTELARTFV